MIAGPGCFARMKNALNGHVDRERHTMFQASADNVRHRLDGMIETVQEAMSMKTDEVFTQVKRDYRSVLGGGDPSQAGQVLPREQRLVRKEVMKIIRGVEDSFTKISEDKRENEGAKKGDLKETTTTSPKSESEGGPDSPEAVRDGGVFADGGPQNESALRTGMEGHGRSAGVVPGAHTKEEGDEAAAN